VFLLTLHSTVILHFNFLKSFYKNILATNDNDGIEINIQAPFYDDPKPPGGVEGESYFKLWEHEVVEVFFLSHDDCNDRYLEVEFGPYGQHLGLILDGTRNAIKHTFPMEYSAKIGTSV
jgi:hypothetical protein